MAFALHEACCIHCIFSVALFTMTHLYFPFTFCCTQVPSVGNRGYSQQGEDGSCLIARENITRPQVQVALWYLLSSVAV